MGSLFGGGGDFKISQPATTVIEARSLAASFGLQNEKSVFANNDQQHHRKRRKKKRRVRKTPAERSDRVDDEKEGEREEDSSGEDAQLRRQIQLSQLTSYNQKRRRRRQRSEDLAGQFTTGIRDIENGVKNSSFSSTSSSGRGSAGSSSLVAIAVPNIVITRDDEEYQDSAIHSGKSKHKKRFVFSFFSHTSHTI